MNIFVEDEARVACGTFTERGILYSGPFFETPDPTALVAQLLEQVLGFRLLRKLCVGRQQPL